MKHILFTLILIFCYVMSIGQITVDVSADKDSIVFGDEIELNYQINVSSGEELTSLDFSSLDSCLNFSFSLAPEQLDSLMELELIDGGVFNVSKNNLVVTKESLNGPIPLSGKIKVSITSIGGMMLPKPVVNQVPNALENNYSGPPLFVKPLENMEDINPDFGIIEEDGSWTDYLIYFYAFLGFACFVLVLYFLITYLRKGKKGFNVQRVVIKLPAEEVAIKDLNLLKEKELWQNGDTKGYHTELTRIMRQYIEDRYEVQALEMTSNQLKREMSKKEINPDIVMRFNDILQIADKVKFAKGDAGPEINVQFMDEAFKIVEETTEVKTEEEEEK